jgi:hypothetical protein
MQGFIGVWVKSSTKSSTVLAPVHYSARARRGHAQCMDAGADQTSYPYKMKVQDMTQRYRKFQRHWGMWYAFDNPNAVKFFSAVELTALLADREWLDEATKTSANSGSERMHAAMGLLRKR